MYIKLNIAHQLYLTETIIICYGNQIIKEELTIQYSSEELSENACIMSHEQY